MNVIPRLTFTFNYSSCRPMRCVRAQRRLLFMPWSDVDLRALVP